MKMSKLKTKRGQQQDNADVNNEQLYHQYQMEAKNINNKQNNVSDHSYKRTR